ncbi:hypothetical protein PMM1242 [Prochlorococcus marinus subsp. pastoris str. CCMP1986]|uniref:Uncharacterized protein n=1 Tax=Prochlorococcus marinus subsp. pastoris (strain CCMP1986 / NIES-2087 / MED4) TaxID=59919 RepID=Q7V0L4_PROMP|nr:hypothetical protein [Prochlorococcus marinus]KGF87194.1 hypothetical protein PROCH_0781 [Prochlorococcus marinus str. EQPAC1]CAE19701.1 hypothetical protein PMM1242 [Prochlorococcus marinus subsp. pastoris str. CCMP1986]
MSSSSQQILNNRFDLSLIYLPLWFPIIYLLTVTNVPSLASICFVFSLFLFAETHFASTWLFFFDVQNKYWIKQNLYKLIVLPIYIGIAILGIWFFNPQVVLLLHYLASGYHVTKQSIGISKLPKKTGTNFRLIIYFFSFGFLATGLVKPGILNNLFMENKYIFNSFLVIIFLLYLFLVFLSTKIKYIKNINYFSSLITGIIIYLPILFFKDLSTATAVGVGMHWIQYISIIGLIYFRKTSVNYKNIKDLLNSFEFKSRLLFILIYALVMTIFAFIGVTSANNSNNSFNLFYLIPIIFQLYHFYIDGFIWKFSDPHIRNTIGAFLMQKKIA